MSIATTDRLQLRELVAGDAEFIFELLNEPGWLRFIGDRGIRTLDDARNYIAQGPAAMIEKFGYGLWLVQRRDDAVAVGICGLLKRDTLPDPDIGFAFLARYGGQGYALEAASATMEVARQRFGLQRLLATVRPDNAPSIRLLEKIGLRFDKLMRFGDETPELALYAWQA
ncbi:MAG: GNAT family N-acetyltransferase [Tahibacter sp.]